MFLFYVLSFLSILLAPVEATSIVADV